MTITIDDARLVAEQVVDVLEQRGLAVTATTPPARVLDVVDVAGLLGRSRDWVYAHARELGAFRMGEGTRARLGFDRDRIEAWKRDRSLNPPAAATTPRRRPGRRTAAQDPDLIPYEESQ